MSSPTLPPDVDRDDLADENSAPAAEAVSEVFTGDADDELTGHLYDGIEEYDNPLPGWWKWLFIASIVFGGLYMFVSLLVGETWSGRSSHAAAVQAEFARRAAQFGVLDQTPETLDRIREDAALNAYGRSLYLANCASCHGGDGGGTVAAPNLTDSAYIHIDDPADFYDIMENGANNGAMPAWRGRLAPNDLIIVSGYAYSLRGKPTGTGGKAPEGEVKAAWY
jgi:cytochrome c oxidase cbb3-type subunit 3